jgi:hypothetical protein
MAIVLFFMVIVDGFLTRFDAPVVLYADAATSGLRFPLGHPSGGRRIRHQHVHARAGAVGACRADAAPPSA